MAKIDLKQILIAATTAAASAAAAQTSTAMQPKDVPAVTKEMKEQVKVHPDLKAAQEILDVKTNQEPWYLSVQAWVAIATGLMSIMGVVGLVVPEEIQKQVMAAIPAVVGLISMGALIYNRYFRFKGTE